MSEVLKNIPKEAISDVNKSAQMKKINREQLASRWGFRAVFLAGLYETKDTVYPMAIDLFTKFQINDYKTFAITEAIGLALIGSGIINHHFERQKNAIRINAVNRGIQEEYPDYNPTFLSEGHIDQYKNSLREIATSFKRRFKI